LIVLSTGGVLYCLSGDLELVLTLRIGEGDLLVGDILLSRSSLSLA